MEKDFVCQADFGDKLFHMHFKADLSPTAMFYFIEKIKQERAH